MQLCGVSSGQRAGIVVTHPMKDDIFKNFTPATFSTPSSCTFVFVLFRLFDAFSKTISVQASAFAFVFVRPDYSLF